MIEMEVSNEPVEFTLTDADGKPCVIKVREIGSCKRRAIMQSYLVRQLISEIKDKALALHPDNAEIRMNYIDEQVRNLPSGQAMIDKIAELRAPLELIVKIVKAGMVVDMPEAEIEKLLVSATDEEVRVLLAYIKGYKKK